MTTGQRNPELSPAATAPSHLRARFPVFERIVYLNSCFQGALCTSVAEAYEEYLRSWREDQFPWDARVAKVDDARAAFARLINASSDEVALSFCVSTALNSVVSSLDFRGQRTKLVVSDLAFPTIGQIFHAQEARGASVVHVAVDTHVDEMLERFDAAIDEQVALVALTAVSPDAGVREDVEAIADLAQARGALVFADYTQAAGVVPIDVERIRVDFLATSMVKYLLGSAGIAFLYARGESTDRLEPFFTGWLAAGDVHGYGVRGYSTDRGHSTAPGAKKFESGTWAAGAVYAAVAALAVVDEIGPENAARHVEALNNLFIEDIDDLGGRVVTPREPRHRGPIVAVAARDAPAIVAAAEREGIAISARSGNFRTAVHAYNTEDDMRCLVDLLARNRELL